VWSIQKRDSLEVVTAAFASASVLTPIVNLFLILFLTCDWLDLSLGIQFEIVVPMSENSHNWWEREERRFNLSAGKSIQ